MFLFTPAWTFLFILPFTHTVALRLTGLFFAAFAAVLAWKSMPRGTTGWIPAGGLIAFWAILPLALLPFSIDVGYSLNEIKTEIGYGLLALMTFHVAVRSERALRHTLQVIIGAFLLLTAWAIASWMRKGIWQEDAYFGGSASFSVYLATVSPMLLLVWHTRSFGRATRAVVFLSIFLTLLTGLLSEQRAFWISAGIQIVAAFALCRDFRSLRSSGIVLAAISAFVAVAVGAFALAVATRYGTHASSAEVVAADLRLRYWPAVIEWIRSEPFTGHGFGRGIMAKAYPAEVRPMGIFWHAHNVVLNYGIQLGVAGVVAIGGLFAGLLLHWVNLRNHADPLMRSAGIAGALMVLGVFVRNMTNDMFQRDLALLFWALTGVLSGFTASRARFAR